MAQSWIISSLETGKAVMETWSPAVVQAINLERYKVETAAQYLARINQEIKEGSAAYNV